MKEDTAQLILKFPGADEATLQDIENKSAIICYARLLRRTIRKAKEDEDYKAKMIAFCKQALCDLVPQIDSLSF